MGVKEKFMDVFYQLESFVFLTWLGEYETSGWAEQRSHAVVIFHLFTKYSTSCILLISARWALKIYQ